MFFFFARLMLTVVIATLGMTVLAMLAGTGGDAGVLARLARTVLTAPDVTAILHDPAALWRIGYLYLCYANAGTVLWGILHTSCCTQEYYWPADKAPPVANMTGLRGPDATK